MNNYVVSEKPPSQSMSIQMSVSVGRNQIQRNVGNYNAIYMADDKQVASETLDIPATKTWASNPQMTVSNLVLAVHGSPVGVALTKLDNTVVVLEVKRLLVIDEEIKGFSITNNGTDSVRASANYTTVLA